VNKEASHYVRLFGGNKIGNLIFLLLLVITASDRLIDYISEKKRNNIKKNVGFSLNRSQTLFIYSLKDEIIF
jgi:hypothetical protein